jgi:hypothetical protein
MSTDKKQTEVLMNDLLGFAEKMLGSYGEFHPFGGYLSGQEDIVQVGLSSDRDWENAQQRADALTDALRSIAAEKSPVALGIVTNVSMPSEGHTSDAIRVFLEHRSGYCADVFFYYQVVEGRVSIANVTAQQGVPRLYRSRGPDH